MEDKYIPGQEFRSWTSVPGGGGGLGTVAAAYLAHKAGLIDFNNKEQFNSIKQNGLLGHVAMNAVQGAIAPKGPSAQFQVNPSGVSNDNNADIGGGFNPAGAAPTQMAAPVAPPSSGDTGMDSQMSSFPTPTTMDTSGVDHELIDFSLPNFASLIGMA